MSLLDIQNLTVTFPTPRGPVNVVDGVSLTLGTERLGIVGESGSGKSVFTKSFLGMLDQNGWIDSGSIEFEDTNIAAYKSQEEWRRIRGKKISMVFQDPMTALNPLRPVGRQIEEVLELHQGIKGKMATQQTIEILKKVGIPDADKRHRQYPHEFSGGMRQRVVIAIAMACKPRILICDEPTTALDVTIQAQILDLIRALQHDFKFTTIYITHDLGVVANVADRVAVMYAGQIIEEGTAEELFYDPRHPYTWALLSSLPQLGVKHQPLYAISGTPPNLFKPVTGDAFAPRNPRALNIDFKLQPPSFRVSPTHSARTWLLDRRAPAMDPPEAIRQLKAKYERSAP